MRFGNFELDFSVAANVDIIEPTDELRENDKIIGEIPEELKKLYYLVRALASKANEDCEKEFRSAAALLNDVMVNFLAGRVMSDEFLENETKRIKERTIAFNFEQEELNLKIKVLSGLFWLAIRSHLNEPFNENTMRVVKGWKVVIEKGSVNPPGDAALIL